MEKELACWLSAIGLASPRVWLPPCVHSAKPSQKPAVCGQKQNNIKKCEKLNFVYKNVVFLQRNANVVQLVEHQLPKLRVAGSNPVIRSWDLIHFKGDAAARPHFIL